MKTEITLDNGDIFNGEVLAAGAIKLPQKKIPLLLNFDLTHPIGEVDIFIKDGILKGIAEIPDRIVNDYLKYGIAFTVKSFYIESESAVIVVTDAELYAASIISL